MPGVYLSYPFCAQKCTYCNFASGVFSRDKYERYLPDLALDERARLVPFDLRAGFRFRLGLTRSGSSDRPVSRFQRS